MKILVNLFLALVLVVATFFIVIGLTSLDNSVTVAAGAAMGSALMVFVILVNVLRVERILEAQVKALEEQNKLLRYLARQRSDGLQ